MTFPFSVSPRTAVAAIPSFRTWDLLDRWRQTPRS